MHDNPVSERIVNSAQFMEVRVRILNFFQVSFQQLLWLQLIWEDSFFTLYIKISLISIQHMNNRGIIIKECSSQEET